MNFAKRLEQARKDKRMTPRELADKLGICKINICKWEAGQWIPNINEAAQVANVLEVSLDWLAGISQ